MATQGHHLDRLTAVDASFLTNETSNSHMHVGAILIFEGPPPKYVDLVEHVRGRLNQVPRFRQRLVVPPLEAGRPLWADDVNFNLTYHIRHTALPEPGGEQQLKRLAARVFSQQLDRSKPLWELWLAPGPGGQTAADAPRAPLLPAAPRPLKAALGAVARAGAGARPLRPADQDASRDGRRHLRRRHRHRALRPRAGARAGVERGRLGAAARTEHGGAGGPRGRRRGRGAGEADRARYRGGWPPRVRGAAGSRGEAVAWA